MDGDPLQPQDVTGITAPLTDDDFWVRSLSRRYSPRLREIVMGMLRVNPKARPTVDDLSEVVDSGWAAWRENTEEGRRVVMKGRTKQINEAPGVRDFEDRFSDVFGGGGLNGL